MRLANMTINHVKKESRMAFLRENDQDEDQQITDQSVSIPQPR
jgi:hypothetical protein